MKPRDTFTKTVIGLPVKWSIVSKRSILTWLFLLFGLTSIGVAILLINNVDPAVDFSPAIIINAYAPAVSALIATIIFFRLAGVKDLLRGIFRWRVGLKWYALAILGPFILVLISNVLYMAIGSTPDWKTFFDASVLLIGIGPIIAGCFEEIAWRGFGQRLLQQRYMALTAAVLIGTIWATWHVWPLFAPGGFEQLAVADIVQTYIRLIATAVIYAWIYNSTKGSLLLVMLAHASHNISIYLMPATDQVTALIIAGVYLVTALVVVRLAGARTLGRKPSL